MEDKENNIIEWISWLNVFLLYDHVNEFFCDKQHKKIWMGNKFEFS